MSIRVENFWDLKRSYWKFIENFHENLMSNSFFAMEFGQIAFFGKNLKKVQISAN